IAPPPAPRAATPAPSAPAAPVIRPVPAQPAAPAAQAPAPQGGQGAQQAVNYQVTLYDHYEGADYQGYFAPPGKPALDANESNSILDSATLEYRIQPSDARAFRGFHVDVKGRANLTIYGLYGHKANGQWTLQQDNKDASRATVREEDGAVIVTIPI